MRMMRPSLKVTVVCTALLALGGGRNANGSAAGCSADGSRASAGVAAADAPSGTPLLAATAGAAAFACARVSQHLCRSVDTWPSAQ